jgi:hypothetical protein
MVTPAGKRKAVAHLRESFGMREGPMAAAGAHDQTDRGAADHALQVGAPGRTAVESDAAIVCHAAA